MKFYETVKILNSGFVSASDIDYSLTTATPYSTLRKWKLNLIKFIKSVGDITDIPNTVPYRYRMPILIFFKFHFL